MPFFHGSSRAMKIGQVIRSRGIRRTSDFDDRFLLPGLDVETFVERFRPRNAVSRLTGLYMVQRPQCLNIAGAHDRYTYEVRPTGKVTRASWGWFAEILSGLASGPFWKAKLPKAERLALAKKYAMKYWKGTPSENRSGFSEWLTTEFVVVAEWQRRGGVWRRKRVS